MVRSADSAAFMDETGPKGTDHLSLVGLSSLRGITQGIPAVRIGLIDGPVAINLSELSEDNIQPIGPGTYEPCAGSDGVACAHGTFVASMLSAISEEDGLGISRRCTLLVRPIFSDSSSARGGLPTATPAELAEAIRQCVDAGATVLNVSAAGLVPSSNRDTELQAALAYAGRRGVITVAAAGNDGVIGSTVITREPSVIAVVACDGSGRRILTSNLAASIGSRGLRAPGERVRGLGGDGQLVTWSGTSVAAPYVTAALALLISLFPTTPSQEIRWALMRAGGGRRSSIVPPLLDAWAAYEMLEGL